MQFGEYAGKIGVAPMTANRFPKAAPKELGGHARKENVIRVFVSATKGAKPGTRAITLTDLHARRGPTMDPLPHEDPNLQR